MNFVAFHDSRDKDIIIYNKMQLLRMKNDEGEGVAVQRGTGGENDVGRAVFL